MPAEGRVDSALPYAPENAAGPGARLRAAREAAGLSLDQVAQQLKLAPRQVRALEEEDFAQLPGRTFARGFVRNYARLLNLDGEDLLSLLPDTARAPALEAPTLHSTGAKMAELPTTNVTRPGFTRWAIPIVLVACIIGAAVYEWYRGALAPPGETKGIVLPTPAAIAPEATSNDEPPHLPAAGPTPPVTSAAPPVGEDTAAPIAAAEAATPAPDAVAAIPAPLQLRYRGPSWTEIRDRDGQVLISRLVARGSEQSIRGRGPFDIVIGNAREVILLYRGAPVDLSRYTRQNVAHLRLS